CGRARALVTSDRRGDHFHLRVRARAQGLFATLIWSVLASCEAGSGEIAPAEAEASSVATPTVLVAGCDEVDSDGACRLRTRETTLRFWVDVHAASEVEVRTETEILELETH